MIPLKHFMMKIIFAAAIAVCTSLSGMAQDLQKADFNLKTDSISYISISQAKVYAGAAAITHKQSLDFALIPTADAGIKSLEWYNLSAKDGKTPKEVQGTGTKISAVSFDREQFDKCTTAADLKRMTGYLSSNSFSHFAVIRNSSSYYQHCFIFEKENGKRGLLYITINKNDELVIETKAE